MAQRITIASLIGITLMIVLFLIKPKTKADVSGRDISQSVLNNPSARAEWEWMRLHDPATGIIPANIRKEELAYASTLPAAEHYNKTTGHYWNSIGPYNVGGRTRALAVDVTNDSIIFAGGVSGGLWRSTDDGASWTKVTRPDQHHSITCIAQDTRPGKTNVWYYGSGETAFGNSASKSYSAMYLGNGIYKSTDGGLTWDTLSSTVSNTPEFNDEWDMTWDIETDPSIDSLDVVYAATTGMIMRSTDGGKSWTAVLGASGLQSYLCEMEISSSGVLYAAMSAYTYSGLDLWGAAYKGIWRSDNGTSWNKITAPSWPAYYYRTVLSIDPSNENNVYFLSNSYLSGAKSYVFFGDSAWHVLMKYTYLSGNGTDTNGIWTDLSANLPVSGVTVFDNFYSQTSYDLLIAVKPDDSNTVFIGGTNLYRSTDAFKTSSNTKQIGGYEVAASLPDYGVFPNHHPDNHALAFKKGKPDIMLSGTDGGVHKTSDCNAVPVIWDDLSKGYVTSQFYTIAIDHGSNNNIVVGGLQDNGTRWTNSPDPKGLWTHPSSGDGAFCAIEDGAVNYYFSHQKGRILKYTLDINGNAAAFRRIDPGIITKIDTVTGDTTARKGDYLFINPFILDPTDQKIMYLSEGINLWRQNDLSQIQLDNRFDTIFAGWSQFTGVKAITGNITALATSVKPAHRLYYGTTQGKIYRIDSANTGNPAPDTIGSFGTGKYVSCIAVDPRDADKVIAVFSNYKILSLFYTNNGGSTWNRIGGALEGNPPKGIIKDSIPESVYNNLYYQGNGPSCRWVSIIPVDSFKTIYLAGTSVGLFYTDTLYPATDYKGDTTKWFQEGSGTIGNVVVEMIDYRESDGFVAIGTHGNGVYTSHLGLITGTKEKVQKSDKLHITNFPNPAKEYTQINFYLDSKSIAKLTIMDSMGRLICTLTDGTLPPGNHYLRYKTDDLPAGIYFYTLYANHEKITKRMVVID